MLSASALSRRFLAVMLAVCFFWIPVACMTLCNESDAEPTSYAKTFSDTFSCEHDRDCCPITAGLPGVLPEHRVTVHDGDNQQQLTQISTVRLVKPILLERGHVATPVSNSDPPFERLWTLRI